MTMVAPSLATTDVSTSRFENDGNVPAPTVLSVDLSLIS